MKKTLVFSAAFSLVALTHAGLYVVGDLQTEQGDPADWDPPNSSLLMADQGGGVFTYSAANLLNGTPYEFKVIDDLGAPPPAWGNPEVVNVNTRAYGDADGIAIISVDTSQDNSSGGKVTWINSDAVPLQVVGNFMVQAGGASDWNNNDAAFNMSAQGGGYYTIDLAIGTAGNYEFKTIIEPGSWDHQVGADGFNNNASTYAFSTTSANEAITMYVDTANGAIGVIPEPATIGLVGMAGLSLLIARRRFLI